MIAIKKVLSSFGLAMKAGKIKSGEFSAEASVKDGKSCLIVVAEDASDNTKKKFNDMCTFYHVPIIFFGDKYSLGKAIGKEMRAMISVNDSGFAGMIQKQLDEKIDQGLIQEVEK